MQKRYITPLNLSKLGFRYFRIVLESKHFSRKFKQYVINHPNIGYIFEGSGWSGKKQILAIGIWATSNAEITDIATHIRAVIPNSYKIVYQSELTRLEYFTDVDGRRQQMALLDELEQKQTLTSLQTDFLKLISTDGSLSTAQIAALLGVGEVQVEDIAGALKKNGVYYGVFENIPLSKGYTKFFIDTSALSIEEVESFYAVLKDDKNCIYSARGNGKYNVEFEYVIHDPKEFERQYKDLLTHSKRILFDRNIFTNLFPQSKSLNVKVVQDKFVELAKTNDNYFDLRNSELWYVSHEGTNAYLDIYSNENYREAMKSDEVELFDSIAKYLNKINKKFNVIDLGSGDGLKALAFIGSLGLESVKSYFPVDIQELELAHALQAHTEAVYAVHPTVLGFNNLSARFPLAVSSGERNIFVLFGGTYGNFRSSVINTYLNKAMGADDMILVSMPIRNHVSKEDIKQSYLNETVEKMGFGVLKQIGFERSDFAENEQNKNLIIQPKWIEDTLVQSFVLKKNKQILNVSLESGTVFDIMSSWKPSLSEFHRALEQTFEIEEMFTNRNFAIALCKKKG